jgi:hypothetical protein
MAAETYQGTGHDAIVARRAASNAIRLERARMAAELRERALTAWHVHAETEDELLAASLEAP